MRGGAHALVFSSECHSAPVEAVLFSLWSSGASVFRCKSFSIVQQVIPKRRRSVLKLVRRRSN